MTKKIEYIAFSFLYGYNENEMKPYNTMRNISLNGYVAEETSSDSILLKKNQTEKPKEMIIKTSKIPSTKNIKGKRNSYKKTTGIFSNKYYWKIDSYNYSYYIS